VTTERLLKDLVRIPTSVQKSDFVVSLAGGITDPARTIGDYVVTRDLAECFDQALALIGSALGDQRSKGAYLHGSFGSGKSHFMSVLHLLLQGNPDARAIGQLAPVIARHDDALRGANVLLVPYHFIGAASMEAGVLGGYVDFVRERFPDAPLPAVFLDDKIFDDARRERTEQGDETFFRRLSRGTGGLEGFGDLAGGWDAQSFERALAAPPDDEDRRRLAADLIDTFFTSYADLAAGSGEGYVPLDEGLAAISRHAKDLGYDGVILFLDELILWLATRMADPDFVSREGAKVGLLVEGSAPRAIPLISFIARQRDLKDFIGDGIPGAQKASFSHGVQWWDGRFSTITLSDANLPAIVEQRLLKPVSESARQELDEAFERFTSRADRALDTLMTDEADKAAFRRSYPFSPALIKVLVGVSAFLQRERTALRLLMQLLVDRRDQLTVGQLVPMGDLWDVIDAGEEPFDQALRRHFAKARALYTRKLRPLLLDAHNLTDEQVDDLDPRHAFFGDDRLAKTLLLAALVPDVDAVRGMTVGRLTDLNHGTIRSPVPGGERGNVLQKVRRWSASVGELRVDGDDQDPSVSLQLVGVDVGAIIEQASSHDSAGARLRMVRDLLGGALDVDTREALLPSYRHLWRGRQRETGLAFANIGDQRELPDHEFRSTLEAPKVVIGYPFDDRFGPVDDLARVQDLRDRIGPVPTLCWVPRSLTDRAKADLGKLVVLDFLLTGDRLDQYTAHLPQLQRIEAKEVLTGQREQLKAQMVEVLRQAYGVASADPTFVQDDIDLGDQFPTLDGAVTVRPPTATSLKDAFHQLLDQLWSAVAPAHPPFPEEVRKADVVRTLELIAEAARASDRRLEVAPGDRRLLTKVIAPLQLAKVGEAHLVLDRHWRDHVHRMRSADPGPLTVARIREWLDQPQRMALDAPLVSLVVSAYALDEDLVLRLDGMTLQPTVDRLDPRVELATVPLPSEAAYRSGVELAAAVFGVHGSPLLSAANVSDLATSLRQTAEPLREAAQALPGAVIGLADRFGVDRGQIRERNAQAGLSLVQGILGADSDRAAVEFLAELPLPSEAAHLGASIKQAGTVAAAIGRANLELLEIAFTVEGEHAGEAAVIRDRLTDAIGRDQFSVDLAGVLDAAVRDATALMAKVTKKPPVPPVSRPPSTSSLPSSGSRTVEGAEASTLLRQLADSGRLRRVEVSWELDE
jgi:hypothetical protein